jgi:lipid-binding SYLF domain-containing protein
MKLILVAAMALTPLLAQDREHANGLGAAAAVFSEVMSAPDSGIPKGLLQRAPCIIIVPNLKRGEDFVGGKFGKGYLSCKKAGAGWSAPGTLRIEGGNFGIQIDDSPTDLIMLVMNEWGADKLLSSTYTIGKEGSVAAGPVGRHALAPTDPRMRADILSWTRSQGLLEGVALEGATLRQDVDDNAALYGSKLENREIVTKGVRPPKSATNLLDLLNLYCFGNEKTVSEK